MDFKALILLTLYFCRSKAFNYTITASEKFRPDTDYKFIVTIYGESSVSYQLKARIKNIDSGESITEAVFHAESPGINSIFELKIPKFVRPGHFKFQVKARGDVNFNETHTVYLLQKSHSIFIQTDKGLYKPGQKVLFRVLGIHSDLKPYTDNINITIYDQLENRIYQLLNQKNQSGVINGYLKLSFTTPLGRWKIEAESEKSQKKVFFEVAEYVLPKFEVKILTPSYFFFDSSLDESEYLLLVTVTAIYMFGKPVKGITYVKLKLSSSRGFRGPRPITKSIELVDGKADITFYLEEFKQFDGSRWNVLGMNYNWYDVMSIQARVTEETTGIVLQKKKEIPIYYTQYHLTFLDHSSNNFKPGFPYRFYIKLSQVDGSEPKLSDIRFPNGTFKSLEVELTYRNFESNMATPSPSRLSLPLTENGYIFYEIPIERADKVTIRASFSKSHRERVMAEKDIKIFRTRDNKYIRLSLIGIEFVIKPRSSVTFNVRTNEDLYSFQYQLIGKGKIIFSQMHVEEVSSNNMTFSIYVSNHMALHLAPQATVVVFYVTSTGELVADSLSLSVTDYMANKVSLSINPESTSPGEEVLVRVNASQDSCVLLSAIDQSMLLLSAGNEINHDMLHKDLNEYASERNLEEKDLLFSIFRWPVWIKGGDSQNLLQNSGLFILTKFHIDWQMPIDPSLPPILPSIVFSTFDEGFDPGSRFDGSQPPSIVPDSPRKDFPETWIWSDIQAGSNGFVEVKYKVPDTITSWAVSAFATSSRYGLGITEHSTKITVLKPFFILLNLPYSVIKGEEFALQVTVFNYYGMDLPVTVVMQKSTYYHVKECFQRRERNLTGLDVQKNIFVKNNDAVSMYFWIVPTHLGQIPIEVRAFTSVAGDSLIRNLLVKPVGEQHSYSSSSLIRIPAEDLSVKTFDVTLPPRHILVNDSVIIEATLTGDVMGTTINNLDNLLQMPHGSGEQNMVTLAPDVYIVKYLTATNQLTEEIKNKALEFINAGYQRELTYQRTDGSFSAFGNNDAAGSVWLSAFVVKVLQEAKGFLPVDEVKMAKTIRWILRHQTDAGAFIEPPNGNVLHIEMQGLTTAGVSLTAYVLISLLVNKNIQVEGMDNKIQKSVNYLERHYEVHNQDPYALSIIGYALYLAGSSKLNDVLANLNSMAVQENGLKYWHKSVPGEDSHSSYLKPQSNDIEMTSYVLQIYASQLSLNDAIPIAKWLISKRNPEGGFTSTQDTVLGLEALAMFGNMVSPSANAEGLNVQVIQNVNEIVHRFTKVNKETALQLQSHQLRSEATRVSFSATGEGLALVQLNVRYNVIAATESSVISQTLRTTTSGTSLKLHIYASWNGSQETGMVLIEVNLLTGYTLADGYADLLREGVGNIFKKEEFNNNRLSIYLVELTESHLIINFESIFYVKDVKPALVKTYRYYAPGVSASDFYSPTSSSATMLVCDSLFNQLEDDNNQTG